MKKFLPKTFNNPSGFTLIELLVVISILAVLSVIGFAAFGGLTGRGNDARRSGDIQAFADAMEVKRGTGAAYVQVLATDFSTGKFPSEPTNRTESYCYKDGTAAIDNTTVAQWANLAVGTKCPTGWEDVSGSGPLITDFPTFFKFCTINQANQGTGGAVICQGSKQ